MKKYDLLSEVHSEKHVELHPFESRKYVFRKKKFMKGLFFLKTI